MEQTRACWVHVSAWARLRRILLGRWIESLSGLEVKVTGDFRRTPLKMTQAKLESALKAKGAIV